MVVCEAPCDVQSPQGQQPTKARHTGYDADFKEAPRDELYCPICTSIARNAMVTDECGHLFCEFCIDVALRNKPECPVCRLELDRTGVRKDVRTRREIGNLPVFCGFRKKGCTWSGTLAVLESHEDDDCGFAVVKCPNSHCDLYMQRCMLDIHMCLNYVDDYVFDEDELEERECAAVSLQAFFRGWKGRFLVKQLKTMEADNQQPSDELIHLK
mmetsp:Transcript_9182/g.16313  ORF Transcript_9182/g.16313 Transcript_9182/m.16313 type:complete len:213 (-) Transcript_9182:572-1210(-)